MKKLQIILFLLITSNIYSQITFKSLNGAKVRVDTENSFGLIFGHQGFNNNYGEIGIGSNFLEISRTVKKVEKEGNIFRYTRPYFGIYGTGLYDYTDQKFSGIKMGMSLHIFFCEGIEYSHFNYDNKTYNLVNIKFGIEFIGIEMTFNRYVFAKQIDGAFPKYFFAFKYYLPIVIMK